MFIVRAIVCQLVSAAQHSQAYSDIEESEGEG